MMKKLVFTESMDFGLRKYSLDKFILLFLFSLMSCQEDVVLNKGSNLIYKNNEIIRIHCPTIKCINKKKWSFKKDQVLRLLRKRIEFEKYTITKQLMKKPDNQTLKDTRNFYDTLNKNIEANFEKALENNFQNKILRDLIFAATDSEIMKKRQKKPAH